MGLSQWSWGVQPSLPYESVQLWFRRLRDAGAEEVLCLGCSEHEDQGGFSMMAAEAFLRKVLETCTNKPLILVDKGLWYPEALRSLGLKWKHMAFALRNRVEHRENLPRSIHNYLQHTTQNKNLTASNYGK